MKISWYFSAGLMAVAFMVGIGVGYSFTAEYTTSMYDKNPMNLGRADRLFDLRYINAMIAHHRGAMLLAEQLQKNTNRDEMKKLAADILKNEPAAIDELYAWKKKWYRDSRVVRDPIVSNLGASGETFDLRFLNALIAHHEAGIIMTKEAHVKSSRSEILDNAYAVEAFLSGSMETLKDMRKNWYNL